LRIVPTSFVRRMTWQSSLEAWKKVLDELREYGSICVEYTAEDDKVDAVVDSVLKQAKQAVLEIINKHLMEVTQNE